MILQFIFQIIEFFSFDEFFGTSNFTEESYHKILNIEIYAMVLFTIQLMIVGVSIIAYPYYKYSFPMVILLLLVRAIDLLSPLFYNYFDIIQLRPTQNDDDTTLRNVSETIITLKVMFNIIGDLFLSIIFLFPNIVAITNHIIHNFKFNLEVSLLKYLMIPFEGFILLSCIILFGVLYQINLLQGFEISLLVMTIFTHLSNVICTPNIMFDNINETFRKVMYVISYMIFIAYPFVILGLLLKYNLGFDLIMVIQNFYFGRTIYYDIIIRSLLNRFKNQTRESNNIIRNSGITRPISTEMVNTNDSSII